MSNPLYNALGGGNFSQGGNNFAGMVNQFLNFKNNFTGDPKTVVQNLLSSGKMSQAQFNQLQSMANQFMRILPK